MDKSLKKEQVDLLRFEKQLLSLGAGLGALSLTAAVDAKSEVREVAATHSVHVQEAYLNLVETVQTAHHAIEVSALDAGFKLLQTRGMPKDTSQLMEMAKSLVGLG